MSKRPGSSMNDSDLGSSGVSKRSRQSDGGGALLVMSGNASISRQMTNASPVSAKLEWSIANFDKLIKLYKPGQNLLSKPMWQVSQCPSMVTINQSNMRTQFMSPLASDVVWELHVYPNGKREEDTGQVSFFLRQIGTAAKNDPIQCEFQIYCLKANQERASVCRDTKDFVYQQGRGKFQVARDKIAPALGTDGSLLVVCEVEYCLPGQRHAATEESAVESDFWMGGNNQSASESHDERGTTANRGYIDLRPLLQQQILTDCAFVINECGAERTVRAHRCILALHSQVFQTMLSHDGMTEADSGIITITDSGFAPVNAMVEYMYTGELDTTHAEDVLVLAEKYDLRDLKSDLRMHMLKNEFDGECIGTIALQALKAKCERFLVTTLNDSSVCDLLTLADTHNAHRLRAACTLYLASNRATALNTDDWLRLKRSQPLLANDILEHIVLQGPWDWHQVPIPSLTDEMPTHTSVLRKCL